MNKKTKKQDINQSLIIYQTSKGDIEFRGDVASETMWATQTQIANIFGVNRPAVTKHINNIIKEEELLEESVCSILEHTGPDGKRYKVLHYNLDMVIAVGYRVNSKNATQFRIWATKTLREYITKGYVINKKHIQKNYREFLKTIETIKQVLPADSNLDAKVILDLVKEFSSTWTSLDSYDKESLDKVGKSITSRQKAVTVSSSELLDSIAILRTNLIKKGEATEIFAQEREQKSVEGILGNIMQSFGGKPVYPSIEERAINLLYFMTKNHPFVDGNKRCGAWAFIWFLRKAKARGYRNINPAALTAITLLIAESKPEKREQVVGVVRGVVSF